MLNYLTTKDLNTPYVNLFNMNPILLNSKEFYESGKDNLIKKRYNAATDSFFKALVTVCDLAIQRKVNLLPKNHQERFELLKLNYPETHNLVSSLFSRYRKTYNMRADEDDANATKKAVNEAIRQLKLEKEMQEIL